MKNNPSRLPEAHRVDLTRINDIRSGFRNALVALAVCAGFFVSHVSTLAAMPPPDPRYHDSRNAIDLRPMGYDTTEEGLARALGDTRSIIYAIRFIGELDEPVLLDEIEQFLLGRAEELVGALFELNTPVA